MKLKTSEAVFVIICVCAAVAATASVYFVMDRSFESELIVSYSESDQAEGYDISVLNSATTQDFMQVSGIGEVKAGDIVDYRDAIGGFSRTLQLKDVSGISEALYQRIIEHFYKRELDRDLTVNTEPIEASHDETSASAKETNSVSTKSSEKPAETATKISSAETESVVTVSTEKVMRAVDINSADAAEIAEALMISVELADEIASLRERIQYFSTVQELYLCDGMTAEIYRRVKDYVIIGVSE